MTNTALARRGAPAVALDPSTSAPWLILRLGAALCFIGHGAFGFITKAAWLPYFGVVGIPERWAWSLMPWVGAVDVLAGMAVLFAPRPLPVLYMTAWAFWTACLRPLAGESWLETLERAGNYGVPAAFLLWAGIPRAWPLVLAPMRDRTPSPLQARQVCLVLRWTTALLLAGHGALGAVTGKALLTEQYAAVGLPGTTTAIVGWLELGLALSVVIRPSSGLLLFVAAWKLGTESLFLVAGAPVWELVERAGSIAAPLALAALLVRAGGPRRSLPTESTRIRPPS